MRCELHMSGFGNPQVLGATSDDVCEYYERGLLGPGVDYDAIPPYRRTASDPMDANGFVEVPKGIGLGYDIHWDFIDAHRLPETDVEGVLADAEAIVEEAEPEVIRDLEGSGTERRRWWQRTKRRPPDDDGFRLSNR